MGVGRRPLPRAGRMIAGETSCPVEHWIYCRRVYIFRLLTGIGYIVGQNLRLFKVVKRGHTYFLLTANLWFDGGCIERQK
jgi:hypothetical protein